MDTTFIGLCNPGSDEAGAYLDCLTWESWLGSTLTHIIVFMLIAVAIWIVLRLIWMALFHYDRPPPFVQHDERREVLRGDIDAIDRRLSDIESKVIHLQTVVEYRAPAAEKRAGVDARITALVGDLQALKDKLGDPDNGMECEAVPCTRGKPGRWLKAWVPFWP